MNELCINNFLIFLIIRNLTIYPAYVKSCCWLIISGDTDKNISNMKEIKNIIFDIGNVLLRWAPDEIYTTLFGRTDYYTHPLSRIVGGKIWLDMDMGLFSLEEGIEKSIKGNENYREEIARFFREAPYHFYPIKETTSLIPQLKDRGFKLFLLSNFHEYGYGIIKERFAFFKYFDGGVISWEVKVNKPDTRIYNFLLSNCGILPEESVFIDDTEENILAAQALGIAGIHFTDKTDLPSKIKGAGTPG